MKWDTRNILVAKWCLYKFNFIRTFRKKSQNNINLFLSDFLFFVFCPVSNEWSCLIKSLLVLWSFILSMYHWYSKHYKIKTTYEHPYCMLFYFAVIILRRNQLKIKFAIVYAIILYINIVTEKFLETCNCMLIINF